MGKPKTKRHGSARKRNAALRERVRRRCLQGPLTADEIADITDLRTLREYMLATKTLVRRVPGDDDGNVAGTTAEERSKVRRRMAGQVGRLVVRLSEIATAAGLDATAVDEVKRLADVMTNDEQPAQGDIEAAARLGWAIDGREGRTTTEQIENVLGRKIKVTKRGDMPNDWNGGSEVTAREPIHRTPMAPFANAGHAGHPGHDYVTSGGTRRPLMDRRTMWKRWCRALEQFDNDRMIVSRGIFEELIRRAHVFRFPDNVQTFEDIQALMGGAEDIVARALAMWENFVLPFPLCALHGPDESVIWVGKIADRSVDPGASPVSETVGFGDWGFTETPGLPGTWLVACAMPQPDLPDVKARRDHSRDKLIESLFTVGVCVIPDEPNHAHDENGEAFLPYQVHPFEAIGIDEDDRIRLVWTTRDAKDRDAKEAEGIARNMEWSGDGPPSSDPVGEIEEQSEETIGRCAGLGLDFFHKVQEPRNFIVQLAADAPIKPGAKRKTKKGKGKARRAKLPPLSSRPVYISLEAKEIRRRFGHPEPEAGSKRKRAPHPRRAHLRRLESEFYKWKRGQVVPVAASWIGPTSGKDDEGREYRVRVDMASPFVAKAKPDDGNDPKP